jgi:hypothetical protein
VAFVLAAALSACGTGFDAQTTTVYTAPAGADVRTGDVKGLNMLVVAQGDGSGTLVAALVNAAEDEEDDELTAVTLEDIDSGDALTVSGLDSPVSLPAGELVQVADGEITTIGISGEAVEPGQVLRINLRFARAGAITAEIPVVDGAAEEYAEVPTPEPTTDATTEPTEEPALEDGG